MRIEIVAPDNATSKQKGDLLEQLALEFVQTQSLELIYKEMRTNSAEIDLFCKHSITGNSVYIECKGRRANIPQSDLSQLVGKVYLDDISEGWMISTGDYSKDAKGFKNTWSKKDDPERFRFKFYEPLQLLDAFVKSQIVCDPKYITTSDLGRHGISDIEWTLLISEYGRFWSTPKFEGGIADSIFVVEAVGGKPVADGALLKLLSKLDSSWRGKRFFSKHSINQIANATTDANNIANSPAVIEIIEGSKWSDFLPSRLKDFVGRNEEIQTVFSLIEDVINGSTKQRVFAITGDSGIGKSSLITNIRARSRQRSKKHVCFVISIDCRAARSKDYIHASLIRAIQKASKVGIGNIENEIEITNPNDPLSSPSVKEYLATLVKNGQVICLVFDQFEEIYSKQELEEVFLAAEKLFLSAISSETNLILGFAWRKNISLPQEHTAYHMWHKLKDHRKEISLSPLSQSEANSAVTLFEKELGSKLRPEIRQQLIEASAGYPWRLKKLCSYVLDQSKHTGKVEDFETLTVEILFKQDVEKLNEIQNRCLNEIAHRAPIDAHEITKTYGENIVQSLEEFSLLKRSGSSLSIYWDVFRDYLVHGDIAPVPFSFIPSSPSVASMLSVATELRHEKGKKHSSIARVTSLAEGSVANVVRDLIMFGIAKPPYAKPTLELKISENDPKAIMRRTREVMARHTLTRELFQRGADQVLSREEILNLLMQLPSYSNLNNRTARAHLQRLIYLLAASGYLQSVSDGWLCHDLGDVDLSFSVSKREKGIFFGHSTPARSLEVLEIIRDQELVESKNMERSGYRNALRDLSRFGLIVKLESAWKYIPSDNNDENIPSEVRLWKSVKEKDSVISAVNFMKEKPSATGLELGAHISEKFGEDWAASSKIRNGNALKRWVNWIIEGDKHKIVPIPQPGEKGSPSRRTPEKVNYIREKRLEGLSFNAIGEHLGITGITAKRWLEEI